MLMLAPWTREFNGAGASRGALSGTRLHEDVPEGGSSNVKAEYFRGWATETKMQPVTRVIHPRSR